LEKIQASIAANSAGQLTLENSRLNLGESQSSLSTKEKKRGIVLHCFKLFNCST